MSSSAAAADAAAAAHPAGLSSGEVTARVQAGQLNKVERPTSRPMRSIISGNLFTRFNALLGAFFVAILIVGSPGDALFGLVVVANTLVGVVEEIRAKVTLDRMALVTAPRARTWRDGELLELPLEQLVIDDVVALRRGDQVPLDGVVIESRGLEVDESILTGEARPLLRLAGDPVYSGSIVSGGSGVFRASAVGRDTYAARIEVEARRFNPATSELRAGINRILTVVTVIIPVAAVLLIFGQVHTGGTLRDTVLASVAGLVTMVPEGLVLLTSIALALAVVRLARRGALVQELAAVEGLARVDILCIDKTGTITDGTMELERIERFGAPEAAVRDALGAFAAADPDPNPTLRAIAAVCPPPTNGVVGALEQAFSSSRQWSSVRLASGDSYILGASDVILAPTDPAMARAEALAAQGYRVLALAPGAHAAGAEPVDALPHSPALALACLREQLRPDAEQVLVFFQRQGVAVKVLSGDHPATVGAVAVRVGLGEGPALDAGSLDLSNPAGIRLLQTTQVFGRVTPEQKRDIVAALRGAGHVVALVGDGVNDVLGLKQANIGIAMASGSGAAKAVAQVVLVDSTFASLPDVVAEGRRVIANVERLANLFVTKTVYAVMLVLAVTIAGDPYPFLPRQLTLIAAVTIGIPAFFLALAPNQARASGGFLRRTLEFSIPAGVIAAVATYLAYDLAQERGSTAFVHTSATLALGGVGLAVLVLISWPLNGPRVALVVAMAVGLVGALLLPPTRAFFALESLPPVVWMADFGIVMLAAVALVVGRWLTRNAGARMARWRKAAPGGRA